MREGREIAFLPGYSLYFTVHCNHNWSFNVHLKDKRSVGLLAECQWMTCIFVSKGFLKGSSCLPILIMETVSRAPSRSIASFKRPFPDCRFYKGPSSCRNRNWEGRLIPVWTRFDGKRTALTYVLAIFWVSRSRLGRVNDWICSSGHVACQRISLG